MAPRSDRHGIICAIRSASVDLTDEKDIIWHLTEQPQLGTKHTNQTIHTSDDVIP
jgi:hypothetical protein